MSDQPQAQPARRRPRHPGIFSYYGGKATIAPWVVESLPPHVGYVEPFCGSARVLFAKPRSKMEVINDLDRGVVAVMKAARDHPGELATLLELTPYSRAEHRAACEAVKAGLPDPTTAGLEALLEIARLWLTMSQQQIFAQSRPAMWRIQDADGLGGRPERTWTRLPEAIWQASDRLKNVAVECRDGYQVIDMMDHPSVLFYLDPPYHPKSCDVKGYKHALSLEQHRQLAEVLQSVRGMVVLSGYRHPDYDAWYDGWQTLERQTTAGTAAGAGSREFRRTEVLWFNPAAWAARSGQAEQTA